MIEISARHSLGRFAIDVDIRASGRVLALCGPSGAGKTSLLNIIAGLETPREGRIVVGGETFLDTARRIEVPVRRRRLGYVFQEPRLFPHLSVAANLTYGARFAPAGDSAVDFEEVVALLGIATLLNRQPDTLSGGEKQRVAIGRALLSRPRALLLDEPLTAIDDARRQEILGLIETLRDAFQIPMIFVSHRGSEVARLATDVATIEAGRVIDFRAGLGAAE